MQLQLERETYSRDKTSTTPEQYFQTVKYSLSSDSSLTSLAISIIINVPLQMWISTDSNSPICKNRLYVERGKSFGRNCLLFFFFLKQKRMAVLYFQNRPLAKMEYNFFCETLKSNKIGKKRLRMFFKNLYYGFNYLLEIIKILLKVI